jgi:phage gp36-like protein
VTYATKQALLERFGDDEVTQLTDQLGQGDVDDVLLTRVIADADSEIDSYLSVRYALPLATPPPVLTRLACDIVRFLLYKNAAPEIVVKRYQEAARMLRAIAAGEINLGVESSAGIEVEAGAEFEGDERVFSRERTQGF